MSKSRQGLANKLLEGSNIIIPSDMYMIAIWRDIIDKVDNKCALYDVKSTKAIADEM